MFFDNKSAVVGEIRAAMLTLTQFQQQAGSDWVLADGSSATGTRYNSITGNANLPDLRGMYLRGKNNSRSDGSQDPDGEVALGTYQADQTNFGVSTYGTGSEDNKLAAGGGSATNSFSTANFSPNVDETRPKTVVINWFIKIN